MSLASNWTIFTVPWTTSVSGETAPTHAYALHSMPTWVLLLGAFIGFQVLAVLLNVVRQLVSILSWRLDDGLLMTRPGPPKR